MGIIFFWRLVCLFCFRFYKSTSGRVVAVAWARWWWLSSSSSRRTAAWWAAASGRTTMSRPSFSMGNGEKTRIIATCQLIPGHLYSLLWSVTKDLYKYLCRYYGADQTDPSGTVASLDLNSLVSAASNCLLSKTRWGSASVDFEAGSISRSRAFIGACSFYSWV